MTKESPSKKQIFLEKFSQLEQFTDAEQEQKIGEMNEVIDGMNADELLSIFNEEMFNKIHEMIEEKKLTLENAILLLEQFGYSRTLKLMQIYEFEESQFNGIFEKMIIEEEKKKEGKNEKLLIYLCECFTLLRLNFLSDELLPICIPCLMKVALKKEESEEVQKEVVMALQALSSISRFVKIEKELYLNEIKEIIQYHQEIRNLSRLAYQCAWEFLICRLNIDKSLEDIIANELHFGRETARELEELSRNMEWNRKNEEEMNKEKAKEEFPLMRWLETLGSYFLKCKLENKEFVGLFSSIVQLYQISRNNYEKISSRCIHILKMAAERRVVKVEDLLKGGAANAVLEGMQQPMLDDGMTFNGLKFFLIISWKFHGKKKEEKEEAKRKATKKEIFEKLEEEGYEDTITSFHETLEFFKGNYNHSLSLHISDYIVNI